MVVVMRERATDAQVQSVIAKLMEMGFDVPGVRAQLTPFTKNANTSLKPLLTYSWYSSEANT